MPTLFKMSDEKATSDSSTVVIAEASAKPRSTKKYVIIAVSVILAAAIVLTAILVGMYMFSEAQKEIIKYSLSMGGKAKQDVTSDPNENVVQYHISTSSQETWIVNDFNRDIQVMKIAGEESTNCYMVPLNKTNTVQPSEITGKGTDDITDAVTLRYQSSNTPVVDVSFLSKTAQNLCKGVSIYWLYPTCKSASDNKDLNFTRPSGSKVKRVAPSDYDASPYYYRTWAYYCESGSCYWVPCYIGCCEKLCACQIRYSAYIQNGRMYCTWISKACAPQISYDPLYDRCVDGPSGISCTNGPYPHNKPCP